MLALMDLPAQALGKQELTGALLNSPSAARAELLLEPIKAEYGGRWQLNYDAAKQHVKVALTGDGGDELFFGYRRHKATLMMQRIRPFLRLLPRNLPVGDLTGGSKLARALRFGLSVRTLGYQSMMSWTMPDIEALPRGQLFWRSLTHRLGGMGIITLALAIFPAMGVGGYQMFRGEVPGPSADRLRPRLALACRHPQAYLHSLRPPPSARPQRPPRRRPAPSRHSCAPALASPCGCPAPCNSELRWACPRSAPDDWCSWCSREPGATRWSI